MLVDKALVDASLNSPHSKASFLAASSQHNGDWLFALPIASCGLKLDDEAVRVAVGLRLDLFANSDVYVKLHADDIKMYLEIISDSDQHTLQRSICKISDWSKTWQLKLANDKIPAQPY